MKSLLKKGKNSAFSQQQLEGSQPLITPVVIIVILLVCAIMFIPMGLVLLDAADQNVLQKKRYDNIPQCKVREQNSSDWGRVCNFTFSIKKDMKAPVYFFYELDGFYQNNRKYVASKSDTQLRDQGSKNNAQCKPILKWDQKVLKPCGLVARSLFIDRFSMSVFRNGRTIQMCNATDENPNACDATTANFSNWHSSPNWEIKNIAWTSDLKGKFKSDFNAQRDTRVGQRQEETGVPLPDVENKDFVVWMRIAALSSFRKLHRVIRKFDLHKGDNVTITVVNYFTVNEFHGAKRIVLGTTTWAGTDNSALAWTLIATALIYVGLAIGFATALLFGTRKLAEVNRFEWSNRPNTESPLIALS